MPLFPCPIPCLQKRTLSTEDLSSQNFVSLSNAHSPSYLRDLRERFAPYHAELHIEKHFKSAYDIKYLFRAGNSILLADKYFDFEGMEDFVKIPVTDQYNGIICAWNRENETTALKNFLQILPVDQ